MDVSQANRSGPALVVLIAGAVLAWPCSEAAPSKPTKPRTELLAVPLAAIEIEGATSATQEQIFSVMETQLDVPLDLDVLERDLKSLYRRLGLRARAYLTPGVAGPVLDLEVEEEVAFRGVRIEGVPEARAAELEESLDTESMFFIPEFRVQDSVVRLERDLAAEGYCYATVRLDGGGDGPVPGTASLVVDEGPYLTVGSIGFEGLEQIPESHLLDVMQTQPPLFWMFDSPLSPEVLERDLLNLERFATDEGFLDAIFSLGEITNEKEDGKVELVIRAEEGERYTVGSVEFEGNNVYSDEDLLAEIQTRPGEPMRMLEIRKDVQTLEKHYGRNGYVRNRVEAYHRAETGDCRAKVIFLVQEGEKKRVRGITLEGNTRTKDEVILRELTLHPGDVANVDELLASAKRLRARGYFKDERGKSLVRMKFTETEDPYLEDISVEVEEGETGWLFFSLGGTTDLGFFGGITVRKVNFDLTNLPSSWNPMTIVSEFISGDAFHGGGQHLALRIMPGTERSDLRLSFTEPYWIGPDADPTSLNVELYDRRFRLFDEFTEERFGLGVRVRKDLSDNWRGGLFGRIGFVTIDDLDDAPGDVEDVEGTSFVPVLGVEASYRSDVNWPAAGTEFAFEGKYELLGGDAAGQRIVGEASWTVPVFEEMFEGNQRIAARIGVGAQHSFRGEVPFYERFQGGGSSGDFPLRGFEYHRVGPEVDGVSLGGELAYSATLEYQFPLYATYDALADEDVEVISGAVFMDAGSIASDISDLLSAPRLSVGVGASANLPFLGGIPLGLDLGLPLLSEADDEFEFVSARMSTRF